jgi:hypothetical protein
VLFASITWVKYRPAARGRRFPSLKSGTDALSPVARTTPSDPRFRRRPDGQFSPHLLTCAKGGGRIEHPPQRSFGLRAAEPFSSSNGSLILASQFEEMSVQQFSSGISV